ncbi:CDP-alcohol phosphatidyltransferase [Anaerocolumna cellulosilytica]|uniref:CDP-alcohol phosphatidyltransferase n=1 Tax=Anaerocolumna cellulosilytica TaxID=433286 RepID=A0A6S6R3Q5_9FIRM|nr:CDP-alcohol phosphatidyltransferase family protein [Anaerocolumna cellulosilytica]MBB5196739.1 CDP-diacylglycerol--glycerol-3-phosphate 3-phosphatidyltransferase [Anaerocolumna cellulosilytica]BCJ94000.1 CDP-alcohol phosphatidyltransferase [Anaerocolumna cellulosilytica]
MKLIPNILSLARIALSVLLLLIPAASGLFLIIYLLCGLTDIADGYIARHYHAATTFGAKLDSLADFIFWGIVIYVLLFRTDFKINMFIIGICIIIAAIRLMNFIITRYKFKQWAMMHTYGNKLTGLALFLIYPFWIYWNLAPYFVIIIPLLSALEEGVILLISKSYDVNRKSIWEFKRTLT